MTADPPASLSARTRWLVAIVLGLLVVGPALVDPTRWLAGRATVDSYGTWWFQWWVARAASHLQSPFFADVIFHPWGKDILTHTGGNLLDAAAILPARWLLGPQLAWNLLVFMAVATNAAAAGAWAQRLAASRTQTLAAQAIVGLHPFVLNELAQGRPTQALLAPLLLALMYGEAGLAGDRRALAASGAALALTGLIYWYAAAFGALALTLLALGRPLVPRLTRLAGIGAISLVLCSPLVVPLALALLRGEVPGLLPLDQWRAGVQEFTNAQGGPVFIASLDRAGEAGLLGTTGWVPEGLALGVTGLVSALLAPRRWWPVLVLTAVIVAGPFPAGHVNLPYIGLVSVLPPFHRLYWPVRATVLFAAAAVLGVVHGGRHLPSRVAPVLAIVLGIAAVVEPALRGALPIGRWEIAVPTEAACLRGAEGAGIVLPYGTDQQTLVWQTVLEAPMLNGMAERSRSLVPEEQQRFREENTWVDALIAAGRDPEEDRVWTEEDHVAAQALGYRWVVLRSAPLLDVGSRVAPDSRLRKTRRRLTKILGEPVVSTPDVTIWGDACQR